MARRKMVATGFVVVDATNPNTGEVVRKLRVKFSNGEELPFMTDLTIDEVKSKRNEILSNIVTKSAAFGLVAMVRRSVVVEEF